MTHLATTIISESRTLWMGDIEPWMDENYIASIFTTTGALISVKVIRDKNTGLPAGYGFVEFSSHEIAQQILQTYNGTQIPGTHKTFRLNWGIFGGGTKTSQIPNQQAPIQPRPVAQPPPTQDYPQIYVGDLDPSVTDQMLLEIFQQKYKAAISAKVIVDSVTRFSKGYGFVKFTNADDASKAISEMNGTLLKGRHIKTSPAFWKSATQENAQNYLQNLYMYGGYGYDQATLQNYYMQLYGIQSDQPMVTTLNTPQTVQTSPYNIQSTYSQQYAQPQNMDPNYYQQYYNTQQYQQYSATGQTFDQQQQYYGQQQSQTQPQPFVNKAQQQSYMYPQQASQQQISAATYATSASVPQQVLQTVQSNMPQQQQQQHYQLQQMQQRQQPSQIPLQNIQQYQQGNQLNSGLQNQTDLAQLLQRQQMEQQKFDKLSTHQDQQKMTHISIQQAQSQLQMTNSNLDNQQNEKYQHEQRDQDTVFLEQQSDHIIIKHVVEKVFELL